jgi:ankyrin repeat protein
LFEHGKQLTSSDHETFIKEWLGGKKEQIDALFYAVNHNNAEMLAYLLREIRLGGVVNSQSEDGNTLLHAAARKGNERMIFELAGDEPGFGGNVNAVDADGNTPLHVAAESNRPSAARFLLSLGAELEARNNAGDTALHLAVQAENLRTAKDLLLKGAERKARNERNQVPGDLVDQIHDRKLQKSFKSALSSPWYYGCPLGRLPLMPVSRNNRSAVLFVILFFYICITQIVVI